MIFIGIAGGCASGKTTIANKIKSFFEDDAMVVAQDCYYKDQGYLTEEERASINFDHPDSLDFDLMQKHLLAWQRMETVEQPIYNFHTHTREKEFTQVTPKRIVIIEGILILAVPEIRKFLDLKIYVDTADDIRLLRRIERDLQERGRTIESIREQYLATVHHMHSKFVEPSKKYADVIIPRGGENKTAIDIVVSKLKQHTISPISAKGQLFF